MWVTMEGLWISSLRISVAVPKASDQSIFIDPLKGHG